MTDYTEVAVLASGDLKARITRRVSNIGVTQYAYQFFRTFVSAGEERQTSWLNPRHLGSIPRLLVDIATAIEADKEGIPRGAAGNGPGVPYP